MEVDSTVGDFVTLKRGTTYKGPLVGMPGPALLGLGSIVPGGGFRDDYKTYGGDCPPDLLLVPGDLYVSLKGATKDGEMIGSVARLPSTVPSGRLTQDTVRLVLRVRDAEFERYLYWLLRTPEYRSYCAGRATGSAVVALSRDDFLGYPVRQLTAQRRRIVGVLEHVESKIESNRRASDLIDRLARVTFQKIRADATPARETTFGVFASVFGGATPKTTEADYWGGAVVWATPTDVTRLKQPYLFETSRTITQAGLSSCSAVLHPVGTIFMTSRATIGAFAINQVPAATNQGFVAVRPERELDRWFLFEEMRSRVDEFLSQANGSTFLEISRGTFKALKVSIPPDPVLREIDQRLGALHAKAAQLAAESRRLAEFRDTLLPELLSSRVGTLPTTETAEAVA
jgi:type I restriction enzyme S subunit